jgi:hypothetical protein
MGTVSNTVQALVHRSASADRLHLHIFEVFAECDVQEWGLWPWIYACPKFARVEPDTRADKISLL